MSNTRVNDMTFISSLEKQPVVAAVKDMAALELALKSECEVVFVLFGDILSIATIVQKIKGASKIAIAHIDLIEGFSNRDVCVEFLAERTLVDGILSTRTSLIQKAHQLGLIAIQRLFLLDSLALDNLKKQSSYSHATAIEILPGLMPRVISEVVSLIQKPVIAGGLIREHEDAVLALKAGAMAISTTKKELWT